jgi:hypothetical protein
VAIAAGKGWHVAEQDVVVKVTTQHPTWPLLRQTPGGTGRWGRFTFVVDEPVERCDYWIVCDGLSRPETVDCPPGRTYLVTWEPPTGVRPEYDRRFVGQFAHVLTCHPGLRSSRVVRGLQGHPWFVGRTYDELSSATLPEKTVPLVIITSAKAFSRGHRERIAFALTLKERFGEDAQLVGRGIADFVDKWDVLAPARYTVAAENAVFDDWITEKLPDCYLAGAFPLYHGAPNAADYFPSASFARIDVRDVDGATGILEKLLADEGHYDRSREALMLARRTYLDELQLFPLLTELMRRTGGVDPVRPAAVTLHPERPPSIPARLRHKVVSR